MIRHALLIGFLFITAPLLAQQQIEESKPPTLTVTGNGEVSSAPDHAIISVGVQEQAPEAASAQNAVNKKMAAIIDAAKESGIDEKKVQTSTLSLSPVIVGQDPVRQKIQGYYASNVVRIEVDDLTKVAGVVDTVVKAGANRIDGISFELKDDTGARKEALKDAAARARAKAEVLAKALDVRLIAVQEVTESGGVSIPTSTMGRAISAMEQTPVPPGQIRTTASVVIRYRISS